MVAFARYAAVGGTALAIHLIVLELMLAADAVAWGASAAGFVLACTFNYIMQRLWVFRSSRAHADALPRCVTITTLMLGVNTLLFQVLSGLSMPPVIAQATTSGCAIMLNFFCNRYITFAVQPA